LPPDNGSPTYWARSTAQNALAHGHCLTIPGRCPLTTASSAASIWDHFPDTLESVRFRYSAASLYSLGDLIDPINFAWLEIPHLPPLPLADHPLPHHYNFLRTDQCWQQVNSSIIIEIHSLAVHSPGAPFIYIRKWMYPQLTSLPRSASAADYVVLATPGHSFFEPRPYTYDDIFPPDVAFQRVILQSDMNDFDGKPLPSNDPRRVHHPGCFIRLILFSYSSSPPILPDGIHGRPACYLPLLPPLQLDPEVYNIFTDGSWSVPSADPLTHLFFPDSLVPSGGGSVVLLAQNDWPNKPIHVIQLTNRGAIPIRYPQTWELLALLAGIQIGSAHSFSVHSGCQSAVHQLNNLSDLPFSDH
jgi:hypothetical protein